ncbi:MAG: phosphatase PAP2 family protein [Actinobacteria bacterium]|nr:phosphatase PAP2 family protein [Actinomycetota bacterium]
MYLTLGIVITSALIFIFLNFIEDLFDKSALLAFDNHILGIINNFRNPALNNIMLFITYLGEWQNIVILFIFLSIILIILRKWRYLYSMIISLIFGEIFVYIIKNLIARPRPPVTDALILLKDFSFPSGHSYIAIAFYGLAVYYIFDILTNRILRILIIAFGFILIAALGFSRIYLGVHWPSDVLAGFAASAAFITMIITFLEIREKFHPVKKPVQEKTKKISIIAGFILIPLWIIYMVIFYLNHPLK